MPGARDLYRALVVDEPALGNTVYGQDAIRGFLTRLGAAFPDHAFSLGGRYADGALAGGACRVNVSKVSRATLTSPRSIDSKSFRRATPAARLLVKPRRDESVPSDCRNTKRYRIPELVE